MLAVYNKKNQKKNCFLFLIVLMLYVTLNVYLYKEGFENMHKFERLQIIEKLLEEKGSVVISKLSDMFKVTEETIRNDLAELQDANKIKRVRGGAYLIETVDNEVPISIRNEMLQEEKQKISQNCMPYINHGDTIALDSSTTASTLANLIKESDLSITVITNSFIVGNILMDVKSINLIILGGNLRRKSNSLIGHLTNESIKNYVIDKAFISCSGVTLPNGPTDMNEQEAKIRQSLVFASKKTFLLTDNTKFSYSTPYLIADFNAIDYIIADQNVTKEWQEFLKEKKVQLIF